MLPIDHALALVLFTVGPVLSSTVGFRRLRNASPEQLPRIRLSVYRVAMLVQWSLTAFVLVLWWVTGRGFDRLGLAPRATYGLAGTLLGTVIIVALVVRQRRSVLRDDESLADVRDRLRHVEIVLPHSRREFGTFVGLAVTAGICEEVLYRGYLIQYLDHRLELLVAAAVASIAFGLGHAYQGLKGVALTTLVGGFLAAVYLISGTLFVSMLIHALMDLHSGHLAWRAYDRAAALAIDRDAAIEQAPPPDVAVDRLESNTEDEHGSV